MSARLLWVIGLVAAALAFGSVGAGVAAQGPKPQVLQAALGSGFTYQGQLKNGSQPFSGSCNMQFSLWDSAGNNTGQVGGTQALPSVPVNNGLFTVVLNDSVQFGASAFDGNARWLKVAVQCGSDAGFTALSRQPITAAPYALYAAGNWGLNGNAGTNPSTSSLGTTDNQSLVFKTNNAEAVRLDNTGRLGIGTTTPSDKLTVANGNIRAAQNTFLSEGFEAMAFPPAGWTTGGNANWTRDTSTAAEGTASAAVSVAAWNTASYLGFNYTLPAGGQVRFFWKTATIGGNFLMFCLDNDACTSASGFNQRITGNPDWAEVTLPVSAGAHSFRWVLTTGSSYLGGGEKGWLDRVRFTDAYGNVIADANVLADNVLANRVGIGTTNPSNQLSVVGNTDFMGRVGIGITTPVQLFHMNVITGQGEGMRIDSPNAGHAPAIYLNHTGNLGHNFRIASYGDNSNPGSFRVRDETLGADRLIIDALGTLTVAGSLDVNGNTGLGTPASTRRLDVNGVVGVFDGGARTYNAGLATESNSQILDIGINDDAGNRFGGTYSSTQQGGFLRVDARPGQPLFGFFGRPAGSTNVVGGPLGSIGSGGAVRFELGTSQKFSLGGAGTFEIDAPFVPAGRFFVDNSGHVGIGNNAPTRILQLQQGGGKAIGDGWDSYSSRRFKSNVNTIEHALDKVVQLRGVTFDWKENGKHDIGLIAEEVGQVIPEVVKYEDNGVDAQSVDYSRLVAVLIESTKQQQQQIEQQHDSIETLRREKDSQLVELKQQHDSIETVRREKDSQLVELRQQSALLEARLLALERTPSASGATASSSAAASSGLAVEWLAIGALVLMNGLLLTVVLVHLRRGGRA